MDSEDEGKVKGKKERSIYPTVVFLHGMLGQGRGWRQFALHKGIGSAGPDHHRDVLLLDLRNHGESDHHASMTYPEMAGDLIRFADGHQIPKLTIIGHNMGAKAGMMAAQMFPDRVAGLISLDTAPVPSPPEARKGTEAVIEKIMSLDISGTTRKGAMDKVAELFPEKGIANFITNNLVYEGDSQEQTVNWGCNLKAIKENASHIADYPSSSLDPYTGPAFFLNGTVSVRHKEEAYKTNFPNAKFIDIEGAGHYVHVDKAGAVMKHIQESLFEIETDFQQ